jgi:Flp pilus assembly protein TadG
MPGSRESTTPERLPTGPKVGPAAFCPGRGNRHGAAALEAALILPLLIAMMLGILEIGRCLSVQEILASAASVGGRQASMGNFTTAQVQQAVINYLRFAGLPTQDVTVTVVDLTNPATDVIDATQMDVLRVTVSVPFANVHWSPSHLFISSAARLTAQSTYVSARVDPYPTDITVPPGG